jgi:hypothetical protein
VFWRKPRHEPRHAGLPSWPYARAWNYGYAPSGVLGLVLVVILILMLLGRL